MVKSLIYVAIIYEQIHDCNLREPCEKKEKKKKALYFERGFLFRCRKHWRERHEIVGWWWNSLDHYHEELTKSIR